MILTLDTATVTGWAAGNPGERPQWGSRHFIVKGGNGEILTLFRHWLEARMDDFRPQLVVFESPYIPHPGRKGGPPMNALTLRRLFAMAVTVEAVCWERRVRCSETTALEIAKFWLGTGAHRREAKKAATIDMCRRHGFDVTDDNEADALALWCMAEATVDPAAGRARGAGPLFLPPKNDAPRRLTPARRGPKNDAPRRLTPARRGRRVQQTGYHDAQQTKEFSGSIG